ncbi:MAG: hypothetical protein IRZ08_21130 [Frankia sp.]|nr:hypothetical protein [Frankia sp.]
MRRARVVALAVGVAVVTGTVLAVVLTSGDGGEPAAGQQGPEPSGAASATTPAPVATGDGLTEAERALVATLGPLRVRDCVPAPADRVSAPDGVGIGPDDGIDAAVVCQTLVVAGEPGPAEVVARHYRDQTAMEDDVARRTAVIADVGSCAAGEPSTETWGRSTRRLGTFLCDRPAGADGPLDIFWTVTADQTALSASSPDAAGLIAWWRDFTKP